MVWCGGTTLKVLDNGDGGVALGGEFLLGHLVALLGTALLDGICDGVADGLRLDDIVTAVDLGEVLAIGGAGLRSNVTGGVLLLRSDESTAALGGVQSAAALDCGLAGATSATTGLAADLSNGVPVAHFDGFMWCDVWCVEGGGWCMVREVVGPDMVTI